MDPPGQIGVEAAEDEAERLPGPGFAAKRLRRQADLEIEGVVGRAGDQRPGPVGAGPGKNDRPLRIADDHRAADAEVAVGVVGSVGIDDHRRHATGPEPPGDGEADVPQAADDDMPPETADAELVAHLIGGTGNDEDREERGDDRDQNDAGKHEHDAEQLHPVRGMLEIDVAEADGGDDRRREVGGVNPAEAELPAEDHDPEQIEGDEGERKEDEGEPRRMPRQLAVKRRPGGTQVAGSRRHRGLEGRLDEGLGRQALRGHGGSDPEIVFEAWGEPWLGVAHHDRHARRLPTDLERGFEVVDVAGRDEDGRRGVLDARLAPHSSTAKVAANDPGPAGLGTFDPIGTGVAVGDDRHRVARGA